MRGILFICYKKQRFDHYNLHITCYLNWVNFEAKLGNRVACNNCANFEWGTLI